MNPHMLLYNLLLPVIRLPTKDSSIQHWVIFRYPPQVCLQKGLNRDLSIIHIELSIPSIGYDISLSLCSSLQLISITNIHQGPLYANPPSPLSLLIPQQSTTVSLSRGTSIYFNQHDCTVMATRSSQLRPNIPSFMCLCDAPIKAWGLVPLGYSRVSNTVQK